MANMPMQPPAPGSITVCISKGGDGAFSVGVEGNEMQPVQSVEEAFAMATQLLEAGQAADPSQSMEEGYQ